MSNADDISSSSSPSVSTTEPLSSSVTSMQGSGIMRSLLATQQLGQSLLVRNFLPPDTSSLVPLWRSSYPLLASSLGGPLHQSLLSFIQPMQQAKASIGSVFASRAFANICRIGEIASAAIQIEAIVPPSISFFQSERSLLQNIFPSSKLLGHLLSPVAFSQGALIKDFLSSQHLLLEQMGKFSHLLNASLITLTHWLPERLRQMGERLKLRLLAAFGRAKLCLAPSLSEDMMYRIMGYVEAGDLRPVTTLLWSYYGRNRHARLRQAMALPQAR